MNKAHVIEITKACSVDFMKARNSLFVRCRERERERVKKTEDGGWKNRRYGLTSKICLWFSKVVYG